MQKIYFISLYLSLLICPKIYGQINKEYFFVRGTNELIERRYTNAIANFNVLIKVDTSLYDAYFRRAIAKYNLNDYMGALSDFNKALQLNPVFTYAYFYRAITHNGMGNHHEALRDLDAVRDLRPGMSDIYYSRGLSYFFLQQFDKAIDDFNYYIRQKPNAVEGYINRGTCQLFLKDTLSALKDYDKAISINRYEPDSYSRRGRLYAMQGKNELALNDFNQAIRLDTSSSINYYFRAITRHHQKDIKGALKDFDYVLARDPYNALTLYNRALMHAQIGDYDKALEDYDKAARINPSNVLIYYNRAAVYLEKKMPREAIADYTKAIEIYPDFANAYLNRAYAKRMRNDTRGAMKDQAIAEQKIAEHTTKLAESGTENYADTSQRFDKLMAFDADFGNKNFNNELLQYQRSDITLRPLFRITAGIEEETRNISRAYFNKDFEQFKQICTKLALNIHNGKPNRTEEQINSLMQNAERIIDSLRGNSIGYFAKASLLEELNNYNAALNYYKQVLNMDKNKAYYYFNRSVAQSEMVDFVANLDNPMQTIILEPDNTTNVQSKQQHHDSRHYNYTEAIEDLNKAINLQPDFAYAYYNRGNLLTQSNQMPEAIEDYSKAIELYSNLGEAYYNRGLVQVYLRDTKKGCLDISKAGELGIKDAYGVIKRFCTNKEK
ncbi:MAG: tetratricopeptide repeat protein [Bacteroidales bacterium]